MSIFSLFNHEGSNYPEGKSPIGSTVRQAKRLGLPDVGDCLILDVVPGDLCTMPARYQTNIKSVNTRHLILDELTPMVAGSSSRPVLTRLEPVEITFLREEYMYRFFGHPFPIGQSWAITRPKNVIRIERRDAFRITVESPTQFRIDGEGADMTHIGRLSNLSAGGLMLCTHTEVSPHQKIIVATPAGRSGGLIDVAADVLETKIETVNGKCRFLVRAKFITEGSMAISSQDQEDIIHYIFEEQRLMLRTRKLTVNE
jgi:c-di-GMP-binding flagellar brake protein YcgR